MEWALTCLVEARLWAEYAARRRATASSINKLVTAIASFIEGHRITEDCHHAELIKLRKMGLALLEELERVTYAWIKLWSNVDASQDEDQQFLQMEEVQLEEAGLRLRPKWTNEKPPLANVDVALKQDAIAARVRWNEWVHAALEGGAGKAHAFSELPVPDFVQQI